MRCTFEADCNFDEGCSFGEHCRFIKPCSFENGVGKGTDILQIRTGDEDITAIAYNLDTGIYVRSGCFSGTLAEFEDNVRKAYGNNTHGRTYMLWVEIIKTYWL